MNRVKTRLKILKLQQDYRI